MAQNIEIKARLTAEQFVQTEARVGAIVAVTAVLHQTDTFFNSQNDRLKLREFNDGNAELIAYSRVNQTGPKLSDYIRTPIANPELLKTSLIRSIGIRGVVKKTRRLYLLDQTRVHLDDVEELGKFIELEVVLHPEQTHQAGQFVAAEIMRQLQITTESLIEGAYIDLLEMEEIGSA